MKSCKLCSHVGETLAEPDDDDPDDSGLYLCNWMPALPPTWRYCTREVMAAHGNDAENCPCYQPK